MILTALLAASGCSSTTPTADPAAPSQTPEPDQAAVTAPASECPAPTDACMNEENHADCLATAKQCPGYVVQLESCPLQFDCGEET